jgi:RNA polymerase sigma factor (sigma-70 family)
MPLFIDKPELLPRFRKGDRSALEEGYWAYVGAVSKIVRYGFAHAGSSIPGASIEQGHYSDVLQEIFVKAFAPSARLGYDPSKRYGSYLFAIARHTLVDSFRRFGREIPTDIDVVSSAIDDRAPREEPPYADAATTAVVDAFLEGLSSELRGVHETRYVLGLSQHDAAAALGISRQSLRTLEARLRADLQDALHRTQRRLRRVA